MINPNQIASVEYAGVRLSREKIELRSGGSTIAMAQQRDVRRVSMAYGYTSERPLLQGILGALILAPCLVLLILLIPTVVSGEIGNLRGFGIPFLLCAVGGPLLFTSLRRGPYFLVELEHGRRKFPLSKSADVATLRTLAKAAANMGYVIDLGGVEQVLQR